MASTTQICHKVLDIGMLSRAQGCLLGQLAGDALGSLVEFQTPEQIRQKYPNREFGDRQIMFLSERLDHFFY